jgi:RHS repeat-associated protein
MAERALYRYDKANRSRVDVMTGLNPAVKYLEFDTKHRLAISKEGFPLAVPDAFTQAQHDGSISTASAAAAAATLVESFNYDGSDARLKYTETGHPDKTYSYFTGHRIQSDGIDAFAHTNEGVMQTDSHFTYESDALGRIIRIKSGAATVCAIEYDALGRPSAVSEQGKPIRTFNYLGEFVEQENDNAVPVRQRTVNPATGVPIAYHVNAATRYTLFDRRFNLVGLTDTSGALLESYRYRPFGRVSILDTAGTVIPASLFGIEPIFAGQRFLESTGLYLSKRRLMNPVHGLFLAPDPRGYMDSASLYVYAAQNPMDLVDPDGEFVFLAVLAVMAVGALVAGGLNAARQGIQMAEDPEKRRQGFSWSELGLSMGVGAIAAPILVVAPELAIPLAAYGVVGGISQMRQGNYATGTFDIVTSLAPFGFKGVRANVLGRGTAIGQYRGLGPSASFATRTGRFALIENNFRNFLPSPFGRRVGLGFARVAAGQREGHTAVILENERGGFWFAEKNIGQQPDGSQVASFRTSESPLEIYMRRPTPRPFEYESIRVPRSAAERAMNYAQERVNQNNLTEPFDATCANCSHFAGDVLAQAGFRGMGNGRASGLFSDFTNFNAATIMSYAAPFWARIPPVSTQKK